MVRSLSSPSDGGAPLDRGNSPPPLSLRLAEAHTTIYTLQSELHQVKMEKLQLLQETAQYTEGIRRDIHKQYRAEISGLKADVKNLVNVTNQKRGFPLDADSDDDDAELNLDRSDANGIVTRSRKKARTDTQQSSPPKIYAAGHPSLHILGAPAPIQPGDFPTREQRGIV